LALRAAELRQQQRQLHVLLRAERGHQVVELEYVSDVLAAPGRQLARTHAIDALPGNLDLAAGGRVQAADEVQERGLARTRGAHQRDEITGGDVQVQAVQHVDLLRAALVGLAEVSDRYQGGHDGAPVDAVDWWTRRPCRSGYKAIEARAVALPKRCASLLQVRGCVDCRCRAEGLLRAGRD